MSNPSELQRFIYVCEEDGDTRPCPQSPPRNPRYVVPVIDTPAPAFDPRDPTTYSTDGGTWRYKVYAVHEFSEPLPYPILRTLAQREWAERQAALTPLPE